MTQIILILTIFFNIFLSVFILVYGMKSLMHRLFSLLSFIAAIWTFTNYMANELTSVAWLQSTYAFGCLVISTGFIWTTSIRNNTLATKKASLIIVPTSILLFISSFKEEFIIKSYSGTPINFILNGEIGWGLILHTIYYLVISILILGVLYNLYHTSRNSTEKNQIKYILIGSLICLTTTMVSSFILPYFSTFVFAGLDSIGFLIFLMFIAYSITRHDLFKIKVITTQIIVFLLWTLMISHILIEKDIHAMTLEIAMLAIAVIFGIILIRYVFYSIEQTKRIEELNSELKQAYSKMDNLNNELQTPVLK